MLPSLLISTLLPSVFGAVIEVTHGGDTSEPTYKFTDAVGSVTLTGSSSVDRITASGALASKDFVVSGVPPTSSELTIASCSSPDIFSGATCDRAYDGNSATLWNTNTGTSAEKSITITLSAAKTITRFEIDQDGKYHPTSAAQRAIIYYYDGDELRRSWRIPTSGSSPAWRESSRSRSSSWATTRGRTSTARPEPSTGIGIVASTR